LLEGAHICLLHIGHHLPVELIGYWYWHHLWLKVAVISEVLYPSAGSHVHQHAPWLQLQSLQLVANRDDRRLYHLGGSEVYRWILNEGFGQHVADVGCRAGEHHVVLGRQGPPVVAQGRVEIHLAMNTLQENVTHIGQGYLVARGTVVLTYVIKTHWSVVSTLYVDINKYTQT
jgi:hypothetical protein